MSASTSSVAGMTFNHVLPDVPGLTPPGVSLGDQLTYCPIVVAVTGEADGATAVRATSAIEHRFGSRVSAVQVLDVSDLPLPAPLPEAFRLARDMIGDVPYAEDARARRSGSPTGSPDLTSCLSMSPSGLPRRDHVEAVVDRHDYDIASELPEVGVEDALSLSDEAPLYGHRHRA